MSTSLVLLTTEQEELLLNSDPFSVPYPRTPAGQKLFDKGCDREWMRLERCGLNRIRRCPNGHVDRRMTMNCGFRFLCPDCGKEHAQERFESWELTLKHLVETHHGREFAYLEIFQPAPRTKEGIEGFAKSISKSLFHAFNGEVPVHFTAPSHFVGQDYLKVRLIVLLPERSSVEDWGKLWRSAKVSARVEPMYRLPSVFKEELLAPAQIADFNEAVEQELIFKGVHRLRAIGAKTSDYLTEREVECVEGLGDISVEELPTEMSAAPKKHDFNRCTTCGEKFVEESEDWVQYATNAMHIKWRTIPEE